MKPTNLEPAGYYPEKELQSLFNQWADRHQTASWTLAGVPGWLAAVVDSNTAGPQRATWDKTPLGYSFQPDVVWTDYVIELKSGAKYEPLAIAEVLHHCVLLEHARQEPRTPVIISRYNPWTRATLWRLAGGRPMPSSQMRYVEHTLLRAVDNPDREFLLLHEPFAEWTEEPGPPASSLDDSDVQGRWYRVVDGATWLKTSTRPEDRSPFKTQQYQIVAAVESAGPSQYVSWSGHDGIDGKYSLHWAG